MIGTRGMTTALPRTRRALLGRAAALGLVLAASSAWAQETDRTETNRAALRGIGDLARALLGEAPPPDNRAAGPDGSVVVTDAGLLDLHFRDADIRAILELLSYQARTNIVSSTSVVGRISANLYSVTLPEALDAILTPNRFEHRRVGNTIFVGTADEVSANAPPPETRVFKLRYLSRSEAVAAITPVLSSKGSVTAAQSTGTGGGSGSSGSGSSSGVEGGDATVEYVLVTDHPDRHERVAHLLAQLDQRPRQVLIEATILRATLNEDNQFGVDFTMLGGMDFQNVGSTSDASTNIMTGQTPPNELQHTTFNTNTNLIQNSIPAGFTFGLIKDSIAGFIRALEEVTDVSVVANPKIVALNRQEGEVIIGRRDGYVTTTVTETAAVQKIEFLETGTQIKFRPVINDDGTVRLNIRPKDSNGGLTAANLPFEETTEAHADILVNDGHTILIGGLFRERTVQSRSQVPIVGNIPLIGLAFQKQSNETVREEVIILLTVHVLKDSAQEHARYEALLDDVERVRVGSRKGLLATGRERLAQAYYQEALKQADRGEHERALLNVRMALHNQPRHFAALKLFEELQGRRMWDNEGSRTRPFLLELIQESPPRDPRHGLPTLGRPPSDLDLYRQAGPIEPPPDRPPEENP